MIKNGSAVVDNGKRPIFTLSLEAKALYERLKSAAIGETVEYKELSALIGRSVQGSGRGVLNTARRMCEKEHQIVFDVILAVGLKRLDDIGIVNTGEHAIAKIRRASGRAARRITCVSNYDSLPNDAKVKHNLYVSVCGAVHGVLRSERIDKLTKKIEQAHASLPLLKTLEAFKD